MSLHLSCERDRNWPFLLRTEFWIDWPGFELTTDPEPRHNILNSDTTLLNFWEHWLVHILNLSKLILPYPNTKWNSISRTRLAGNGCPTYRGIRVIERPIGFIVTQFHKIYSDNLFIINNKRWNFAITIVCFNEVTCFLLIFHFKSLNPETNWLSLFC